MLKTNENKLVKISVQGEVDNPHMSPLPASPYMVSGDGQPMLIPMYGGLVYNIQLGDPAMGWAAELIQAGVSIKNKDNMANNALGVYACIGNKAIVMTGDAALSEGVVVGKSSRFAEHVVCSFDQEIVEKLTPEDQILIQAFGVGLELPDYKDIMIKNLDPELLKRINLKEENGKLSFPVRAVFENKYGGAGAGFNSNNRTVSIMVSQEILKEHEIDTLRFGDFVAINNWDSRFGHGFLREHITIGVVSQGNSFRTGYGPAITVIATGQRYSLSTFIDTTANLKRYL